MFQRCAFKKLHGDEGSSVVFARVIDRANIRMIQCGGGLRLTLKATQDLGIAGYFLRQELECDESMQARVMGLIDHTHSPASDEVDDAESPRQHFTLGESRERSFVDSHRDFFPELLLTQDYKRAYPQNGMMAHVIGYTGEISDQELDMPEFAKYDPGTAIGK